MALQPCRECGRSISTSAASCPNCGCPTSAPAIAPAVSVPGPPPAEKSARAAPKSGVGCLPVVVLGLVGAALWYNASELAGGDTASSEAAATAPAPRAEPAREPEPPAVKKLSPWEEIGRLQREEDAIAYARPYMGDTVDDLNKGAVMLAYWMTGQTALRARLASMTSGQTTAKKVLKDSSTSLGKTVCVRGTISQIQRDTLGGSVLWKGLLLTDDFTPISFVAAGSTGELVKSSSARICGYAAGVYSFANVSGGQTQSVMISGVFSLRENTR